MTFGFGRPVRRKEDQRLLTGRGEFSDDLNLPGQAHAYVLRAPHAHARITAITPEAARAAPGVLAVLTGADYLADGLCGLPNNPVPPDLPLQNLDGSTVFLPPDYPLAADRVRHAGEGVALVVAETPQQAVDAAELVVVDYDALPAVTDVASATATGAQAVWDEVPENRCIDAERGDAAAVDAAFANAYHFAQQPGQRRADGAARRNRRIRLRQRTLHASCRQPGRADPEAGAGENLRRR